MDFNDAAEDDLGTPDGQAKLEGAAEVRRAMDDYRIASVGKRPKDYMARDLTMGSWLRDARMWIVRKMSRQPPSRFARETKGLAGDLRKCAIGQRVVHFVQLGFLSRLRAYEDADDDALRTVMKLWNCWPYGIQYKWRGNSAKSNRDVCGMVRHCPFCLARRVVKLHEEIESGPWKNPTGKFLLLGQVVLTDDMLGPALEGHTLAERIAAIRHQLGQILVDRARDCGADGGLTTLQVGPQKLGHDVLGYSYHLSVLASVTEPNPCLYDGGNASESPGRVVASDMFAADTVCPTWRLRAGEDPQALRQLLAGTAVSYRNSLVEGGEVGAFFVPSWPLASYDQWFAHLEATRGMHLYDMWGSWLGSRPPRKRAAPQRGFANANVRRGEHRRKSAFRAANRVRSDAASSKRTELLHQVRQLLRLTEGNEFTPLGRKSLQTLLAMHEITASDRDLRWLAAELKSPSGT